MRHLLAFKIKWNIMNLHTPYEYERILTCTITKEVWDTLEVAHIGITQVKASKVHVVMSQYEIFKIDEGKLIKDFIKDLQ